MFVAEEEQRRLKTKLTESRASRDKHIRPNSQSESSHEKLTLQESLSDSSAKEDREREEGGPGGDATNANRGRRIKIETLVEDSDGDEFSSPIRRKQRSKQQVCYFR